MCRVMEEKNGFILEAKNIKKTFITGDSKVEALKGISFYLKKGEMLAVMGGSGSGKSTLLNVLGALLIPDDGEIWLNGKKEEQYSEEPHATEIRNRHIGFIFQDFSLLNDLSVRENVSLPLILKGEKEKKTEGIVKDIVMRVGLEDKLDSNITQLLGGQQQRIAIARAVVTHPDIVLADEPTGNLDYNTSLEIMDLFMQLKKEEGQSFIIVTHDPIIATYADRVIFLHDGEVKSEYKNGDDSDNFTNILDIFRSLIA